MKKFSVVSLTVMVLGVSSMAAHAEIECKASMMGRICYDSNGKELTVAEMQAATKAAELKDSRKKVAKKN